ncbi:peptidase dimerization domain-containing protein, partial [Desulfovibrio desulfuricans]|nr:peptidase dimerization domain-containing protein [Desulfovibrio desulfuricans]
FYDDVAPLNEMDEFYTDRMAEVFDEDMYLNKRLYTSRFLHDKRGRDAQHALLWEPTLNIDGIWGGYTGPATKTIVPYHATCKVDVRL